MSEYLETLAGDPLAEGRRAFALCRAVEAAAPGTPPGEVVCAAEIFERYLLGRKAALHIVKKSHEPA
ncbi:MAG: hypothetical protein ACKVSF_11105 [Alphaproteobacteria bacterium]